MGVLDGRVALVTGAGRGLGRAHALGLAAAGARVLVNDAGTEVAGGGRDPGPARSVAAEIEAAGGRAVADATDVSSIAGGAAVVAATLDAFGRVDVVANNAGISRPTPIPELDDAVLDAHLGVHLRGVVGTTRAAFAAMADAGGAIVNTVSGAGLLPGYPGVPAYAAAKAAVYAFTLVAAAEGAPLGIRVNAVSPLARTRMSAGFFPADADLDPGLVADVVVFLASDLASGVTGRVLRAGGGEVGELRMVRGPTVRPADRSPEAVAARIAEILAEG